MSFYRKLAIILITFITPANLYSQHSISKYSIKEITDPQLPLITNRLIDAIQPGWMILQNEIDHRNSLKVFIVEAKGDSMFCHKKKDAGLAEFFAHPGHDWVLLIHGDSKMPIDAAVRGLEVQNQHGVKVLVYSWPSMMSTQNGLKNFKNSKENVEDGLFQFRELLLTVQKYRNADIWPAGNKLSLFMHSLGNYYLEKAVKEDVLQGIDTNLFDNIIINAAAVNTKGHAQWLEKLNISRRIYVISNRKDFNLRGARMFTKSGKQLGGPVEPPLADNTLYIDFTKAVGFSLPVWSSHTYFIGKMTEKSKHISEFFTTILHGDEAMLEDQSRFIHVQDEKRYEIIP